ncbi:MAG: hypothetical protein NTW54_00685 [Bacteroidetes bacterium]|nr:hypothetical protein [Bacteroidota bacterium]
MTQVHLHLLITHLPVFGSILGALVLGYGVWSKSTSTKMAAYFLFILSSVGAGIAYLTGEGAEEAVEKLPGVIENIIKTHEEFAMFALISLLLLGVSALVALFLSIKNNPLANTAASFTLFISLLSFVLVARTGYLGGQIRHTEITSGAIQNNATQEQGEKDDD